MQWMHRFSNLKLEKKKKRERFSCTYTVLWLIEVKIIQGVVGIHEWIYSTCCIISSLIIHTLSYFTLCGRFHFIHQASITLRRIINFELHVLVQVYGKYLHILNLLIYISKLIKSKTKFNYLFFYSILVLSKFNKCNNCMHIDFLHVQVVTWNSNNNLFFKLQVCSN